MSKMKSRRPGGMRARRQSGVVLIVVMIMLVIIGFTSVGVMRSALSNDMVSNNLRLQTSALQAAQLALRYCEDHYTSFDSSKILAAATPQNWTDLDNWKMAARFTELSASQLKTAGVSEGVLGKRPQCMVENGAAVGVDSSILITARGFSPDYSEDADLKVRAGSVVWLQSTLVVGTP